MAYYIPLPDGKYAEIPDDTSIEDARRNLYDYKPDYFPEAAQRDYRRFDEQQESTALGRGFQAGLARTSETVGAVAEYGLHEFIPKDVNPEQTVEQMKGMLSDPDLTFDERIKRAMEIRKNAEYATPEANLNTLRERLKVASDSAAEHNPEPTTWADVQRGWKKGILSTASELGAFAGEMAGGSAPYAGASTVGAIAGTVIAPGAGTLAGAALPFAGGMVAGLPLFVADNIARQVDEGVENPEDVNWFAAVGAGTAQAGLNAVGPIFSGLAGKAAQAAIIRQAINKAAKIPMGRYMAAGIGSGAVEAFTEAGQSALERLQAGLEPFESEEMIEAMAGGAVLGFLMGPIGAGRTRGGSDDTKPKEKMSQNVSPVPEEVAQETVPPQLALPAPEGPPREPVFDFRPEAGESAQDYANRAISSAAAEFPEGPYSVDFVDDTYRVMGRDKTPIGKPFKTADQAQEVVNVYNDEGQNIETTRLAKEAIQKTRQQETASLAAIARETITPIGTFTAQELGPSTTGQVNGYRMSRGLADTAEFTMEDLARAAVGQGEINRLIRLRKPNLTADSVTTADVERAAGTKNLIHDDNNFKTFAMRATGQSNTGKMSQTQLKTLIDTIDALPVSENSATIPIVEKPIFSEQQYDKSLEGIRRRGRFTNKILKEESGIKDARALKSLREAMVRRGQIVQRAKNDYRLYDVLGGERQTTPADLPQGVTTSHAIRQMPVSKVKVTQNGKSLGTFNSNSAARDKVRGIRQNEAAENKPPSNVSIENDEHVAYGVVENRYDADGNLLGQAVVDSYRDRAEAEKAAGAFNRSKEEAPSEVVPPKKVAPEVLRGKVGEVLEGMRTLANRRGLPLLGVQVKLVDEIATPTGATAAGAYQPETGIIRLAASVLKPGMKTSEIVEQLGQVMDHELIHALHQIDVLGPDTPAWKTLSSYVKRAKKPGSDNTYYQEAKRLYKDIPGYTDQMFLEEGVAEAFRMWASDKRSVTGKPATAFRQLVEWFRRLVKTIASSAEDLFQAIEDGQLVNEVMNPPGSDTQRAQTVDQMQMAEARIREATLAKSAATGDARAQAEDSLRSVSREYQDLESQAREDRRGRQGAKTLLGFTAPSAYIRSGFGDLSGDLHSRMVKYMSDNGLSARAPVLNVPADPDYMTQLANTLEKAKHDPKNPKVAKQYNILKSDIMALFRSLGDISVSEWTDAAEPYANPQEAMIDIASGNINIRTTESMFGAGAFNSDHPMVQNSGVISTQGNELTFNDVMRIVNDAYGHMATETDYSVNGEYNAFHNMARLVSEEARGALAAETVASTAWHNYGPHLRRRDGSVPFAADADYLPPNKKEFAPQKAFVVAPSVLDKDPAVRHIRDISQRIAEDPLSAGLEPAETIVVPDRFMLRDEPLGDIPENYWKRFKGLLPGGKNYGVPDPSPGGALANPAAPPAYLSGNADGNRYFKGPMVDAQITMAREGERGSELVYMSPQQFETLVGGPQPSPEQRVFDQYTGRGYSFNLIPSVVVKGKSGTVDVVDSDGGYRMRTLASKGVRRVPVIMYPENRENTGFVHTLKYKNIVEPKPPNSENFPDLRGEPVRYSLDDKLGKRVPVEDPTVDEWNIVFQRNETVIGRFLHALGRSEKNIPLVNTSIFRIRTKFQDAMLPVKKTLEEVKRKGGKVSDIMNTYMAEQLYHGRVVERIRGREKKLYIPLLQAIQKHGTEGKKILKDLEDYLYARHAPERNRVLREEGSKKEDPSGISNDDAKKMMDKLAKSKNFEAIKELAAMVDNIVVDTNKVRVNGGLISADVLALERFEHYVPLRGFADEDLDSDMDSDERKKARARTGRGYSVFGKEDPSATGRKSRAGDIIGHVFLQNEESIIRAEKNRVVATFAKATEQNPTIMGARILGSVPTKIMRNKNGTIRSQVDMHYRDRDNIVTLKNKGKRVIIQVDDPRVAQAINKSYASQSGAFVNALATINRYLATVNTALSAEFLLTNLVRDLQTGMILSQQYDIKNMAKGIRKNSWSAMKGIKEVLRDGTYNSEWAQAFRELQELGGTTEFLGIRDLENQLKRIKSTIGTVDGTKPQQVRKQLGNIFKFVEDYNKVAENGVRLAAFKAARDAGVSPEQAAFLAKNLTVNFNKGGESKTFMNSWYLFYNASLQGSMVLVNGLRHKKVQKIAGGIVVAGAVQDAINRMLSDDDDGNGIPDYDEIPQYVLEHNFVIMDALGLMSAIGIDKGYIAIAMPYGFNAFHNMGRNMSAVAHGSKVHTPAKAGASTLLAALDAFNPLGGTQSFYNFVAPTIADPFVDLLGNKDFANRPISPQQLPFGLPKPDSQLFWNSTNDVFKSTASTLNELTGGNVIREGMIDVSPETLEYWYDYALGAMGSFAKRTYDFTTDKLPDVLQGDFENVEFGQVPFLRRFVGNITDQQTSELYYDAAKKVLTVKEELEHFKETGNRVEFYSTRDKYTRDIQMIPLFDQVDSDLRKLRKQLRDVRGSEKISEDTRSKIEDKIQEDMNKIMNLANLRYYNLQ